MIIRVAVVYALADAQTIINLELPQGATVTDALAASRVQEGLPGNSLAGLRLGIWGLAVPPDAELRDRDRVEIYRELVADPMLARRQRVDRRRKPGTRR